MAVFKLYLHKLLVVGATIILGLSHSSIDAKPAADSVKELRRDTQVRPNILFISTDDQAPWALGASGNKQAITPHMDRLVSEGAYLVNSFVSTPVCSPSRAATLTGRYGHEVGVRNWVQFGKMAMGQGLNPDSVTYAELLKEAGYSTSLIGKWHLGEEPEHYPTLHGFDYFMGHIQGGFAVENPVFQRNGAEVKFKGLTADILADDVIARLEHYSQDSKKQPFCIAWNTRAPHRKWLPVASEDMAPYDSPGFRADVPDYPDLDRERVDQWMKEYLASTRSVDRNLGRVMEVLAKLGLDENTIVIYTSDHGYNMGHHGIWHKGNGHWILKSPVPRQGNIGEDQRPNMWENSIRVPSIVRWPGNIKPGIRIDADTTNLDWFSTILAMAGIAEPGEGNSYGENLVPLLSGAVENTKREGVFSFLSFYEDYARVFIGELRMWRTDRWKLVRDIRNPHLDELYDLKNDPDELKNEIANPAYKTIISKLHGKIVQRMVETNDPALVYLDDSLPPFLRPLARPAEPVSGFKGGFAIEDDQTIILLGGTNAVESSSQGYLETLLTAAYKEHQIQFRNMAWQADTVYHQQRPRNFFAMTKPDYGERDPRKREMADIVFLWMGQVESLDGVKDVAKFTQAYSEQISQISDYTRRIVLVTPVPFSKAPNLAIDIEKRNQTLAVYVDAIKEIGRANKLPVVDLFGALQMHRGSEPWSENGMQLSSRGHWLAAKIFTRELGFSNNVSFVQLGRSGTGLQPVSIESLRKAIINKNELWYRYWRPTNWAFLYGNRQTQPSSRDHKDQERRWFPGEISSILPLIEEADQSINELKK